MDARDKPRKPRSTAGDLLSSEFFGIWADRTDITDRIEFASELRKRAWDSSARSVDQPSL